MPSIVPDRENMLLSDRGSRRPERKKGGREGRKGEQVGDGKEAGMMHWLERRQESRTRNL